MTPSMVLWTVPPALIYLSQFYEPNNFGGQACPDEYYYRGLQK
jgi:hypothetical protein